MIATKARNARSAFSSCVIDVSQDNRLLIKEYSFSFFPSTDSLHLRPPLALQAPPLRDKKCSRNFNQLMEKKNLLTHFPFNFCSSIV